MAYNVKFWTYLLPIWLCIYKEEEKERKETSYLYVLFRPGRVENLPPSIFDGDLASKVRVSICALGKDVLIGLDYDREPHAPGIDGYHEALLSEMSPEIYGCTLFQDDLFELYQIDHRPVARCLLYSCKCKSSTPHSRIF